MLCAQGSGVACISAAMLLGHHYAKCACVTAYRIGSSLLLDAGSRAWVPPCHADNLKDSILWSKGESLKGCHDDLSSGGRSQHIEAIVGRNLPSLGPSFSCCSCLVLVLAALLAMQPAPPEMPSIGGSLNKLIVQRLLAAQLHSIAEPLTGMCVACIWSVVAPWHQIMWCEESACRAVYCSCKPCASSAA